MADFVVSDKDFKFVVSSNRYRKTNRAETFEFDKLNGLGVCVSWHEDKNDDEGERVDDFTNDFDDLFVKHYYDVPVEALIRVVLCVPPMSALQQAMQQERAVATAMLLHLRFASTCPVSHLDEFTKDALLRMIVGPLTQNMNLTPVFVQANGVQETHHAVELEPGHPFELPFAVKLRGRAPVVWVLRDAQKKTTVELIFNITS